MSFSRSILCLSAAVFVLSACGGPRGGPKKDLKGAQYWQRSSVSESIYQRGPKAQQMLNRDISRCVTELRELERLGAIKDAVPTSLSKPEDKPDNKQLDSWSAPERDNNLFVEHSEYHDFETCMIAKGWERVEHLPYDISKQARRDYIRSQADYKYQSRIGAKHKQQSRPTPGYNGDFADVNE